MRIQLSIISLLPLLVCSWAKPAPTDTTISAPTSSVATASGSASAAASSVAASFSSTSSASPSTIDTPMSSSPTSVVSGSATATLSRSATSSAVAPHNTSSPPIALGYVADYHIDKTNLQNYPFENYTHMSFFGTPVYNQEIELNMTTEEPLVQEFVRLAHQHDVKAMFTIGGYGPASVYFSLQTRNDSRENYADLLTSYAFQHGFDGIDLDWEYPNGNKSVAGDLFRDDDDTSNFLAFLKTLRSKASNLTLSAAAPGQPWLDMHQKPWTNMSEFASVLDFVVIMNYDRFGSWSATAGPNAALDDSCVANATLRQGSAVSSIKAWTDAGFPASKLVLGVPAYGHGFPVPAGHATNPNRSIALYPPVDASRLPLHGDKWDDPAAPGGTFTFQGLMDNGYLKQDGTPADGIYYTFDNCTKTPFLYNGSTEVMVSYDDAQSMRLKGEFVKEQGLAGFAMFEVGGDHENILLSAVKEGMH
ncbi:glycoside hydrolase family 18 protein [Polyporus arcularius HHB13444]|uniref:Glycoside hydrolase family 18 protein n=1 Tax=Polyporus arcularius HHB13444 TaxID=1314778 RepID=A0A5C3PFL6_9APHY|nr:glycoside hydrolase family 18 protein [Polyporus arcularius HHB13444]